MFKSVDWNRVLNYAWHVLLLGGSVATQIYAPQLAPVIVPAIQAAGQLSPSPSGVTIFKPAPAAQ